MAENVTLKIMKCPTCGANLKVENNTQVIPCMYCGNSVIPVTEAPPASRQNTNGEFNGVIKVQGIKTSSAALAYIEQFFEEYDWEAFAYAQTLSVAEIDNLANSLKVSSADDKNTWFVCFKATLIPFVKKIDGCQTILASVIEEYKKDNLDAYSKFDAYKRISNMILSQKETVVASLQKMVANAQKYGASNVELNELNQQIEKLNGFINLDRYSNIEFIPQIRDFINQKNAKIAATLAAEGIQAEAEYARAKAMIQEGKYVEALSILIALKGYSNTDSLIEKIDKYFLISDVLEIEGILYCYKKSGAEENDSWEENRSLNLYATINGKICEKPIIRGIQKIITNYANILYYLDSNYKLRKHNLSTGVNEKIYDKKLNKKAIYVYDRRVFMITHKDDDYSQQKRDIVELNLAIGAVRVLVENVNSIVSLTNNQLVYTLSQKVENGDFENNFQTYTNVLNVDTLTIVPLGCQILQIEGFTQEYVVYTKPAPNNYNNYLYIKSLNTNQPEKLIEPNIYKFSAIIANKLFYYVGNSKNHSLININLDGTQRKEWPLYIYKVLFEQGGWVYFIRKWGYNSVLCKAQTDGSKFSVIASDIYKFIDIKNGYLYYINDESALVKVRMDGSNLQELCHDVETVLSVKEDKVIFVSIDDKLKTSNEFQPTTYKTIKSIYAVDFTGSGKIKLAYDIKTAKEYDESTVYYISQHPTASGKQLDVLYRLDVQTNQVAKLLDVEVQPEEKSSAFAIAMTIAVIALIFSLIGFAAEAVEFGAIALFTAFISFIIGILIKSTNNE